MTHGMVQQKLFAQQLLNPAFQTPQLSGNAVPIAFTPFLTGFYNTGWGKTATHCFTYDLLAKHVVLTSCDETHTKSCLFPQENNYVHLEKDNCINMGGALLNLSVIRLCSLAEMSTSTLSTSTSPATSTPWKQLEQAVRHC